MTPYAMAGLTSSGTGVRDRFYQHPSNQTHRRGTARRSKTEGSEGRMIQEARGRRRTLLGWWWMRAEDGSSSRLETGEYKTSRRRSSPGLVCASLALFLLTQRRCLFRPLLFGRVPGAFKCFDCASVDARATFRLIRSQASQSHPTQNGRPNRLLAVPHGQLARDVLE